MVGDLGGIAHPKFLTVIKLLKKKSFFLFENFCSEMQKLGAKNYIFAARRGNIKILNIIVSSVGNLQ